MTDKLLLDTCAVLWVFNGTELGATVEDRIDAAAANGRLYLSPISAWEIGLLVAKNRVSLTLPVDTWITRAFEMPGVEVMPLDPKVLVQTSFLPGQLHGDPADRMIIATARAHDLTIVTRDRLILAYAEQGNVAAMPC